MTEPVWRTYVILPSGVPPEGMLREWLAHSGLSAGNIYYDGVTTVVFLQNVPDEPPLTWESAMGRLAAHSFRVWPISIKLPEEVVIVPPTEPIPEPVKTIPDKTNQEMINALYAIANQFNVNGWTLILEAGLSAIAVDRNAQYSGPALEDLPLTPEKARALRTALGLV